MQALFVALVVVILAYAIVRVASTTLAGSQGVLTPTRIQLDHSIGGRRGFGRGHR